MLRARFSRIGATVLIAMLPLFAVAPSAHVTADPEKVLHVAFEIAETGFDPAKVTDNSSIEVIRAVYERPLSYDRNSRAGSLSSVDGVVKMGVSRYRNILVHPQVKGFRHHPLMAAVWEYLDIDPTARRR